VKFCCKYQSKTYHLTYLLTLLKVYDPLPDYSLLPNTGKELIKLAGLDFPGSINDPAHKRNKWSKANNDGKYFNLGIDNALKGAPVWLIHRDIRLVNVYLQNPVLLPKILRDRVSDHFYYLWVGLYCKLQCRWITFYFCIVLSCIWFSHLCHKFKITKCDFMLLVHLYLDEIEL